MIKFNLITFSKNYLSNLNLLKIKNLKILFNFSTSCSQSLPHHHSHQAWCQVSTSSIQSPKSFGEQIRFYFFKFRNFKNIFHFYLRGHKFTVGSDFRIHRTRPMTRKMSSEFMDSARNSRRFIIFFLIFGTEIYFLIEIFLNGFNSNKLIKLFIDKFKIKNQIKKHLWSQNFKKISKATERVNFHRPLVFFNFQELCTIQLPANPNRSWCRFGLTFASMPSDDVFYYIQV